MRVPLLRGKPIPHPGRSASADASRRTASPDLLSFLIAPGAIVAHFDKAVSMDPDWGLWSKSHLRSVVFPFPGGVSPAPSTATSPAPSSSASVISHPFTPVQVKLLWALSLQAETHLHRADSGKTLSFYSFLDPLTHLYNPRYFDNQLEKEILRCRRSGGSFSLLRFDIDGFTEYNERFTNTAGDIALQEFADILSGSVREVDTVARLGGDEFGIILLEGIAEGAQCAGASHHPAVPAAPAAGGQGIPHRAAVGQHRRGVVPFRLLRQGRPV